jgi:hypothetical protein
MKNSLLFILLCFSCSSLLMEGRFAKADPQVDIQNLETRVFIGQAYPSGNVYLQCFHRETNCQSARPKELLILPLGDTKSVLEKTQLKASFVKVMKDQQKGDTVKSIYIPGAEGMDDDHESCGIGEIKKIKQYKYVSDALEDYFSSMSTHCEPNEGRIGIYHTDSSNYSFLVLGIDPGIAVAELKPLSGKRPLTPADKQEIIKQKRDDEKAAANCTGNPAYIDSATQIAEIRLAEGDFRLRLSTYENSSCHGHLSNVYILDVLQRNAVLRKFEVYRFQGAL